MRDVRVWTRVRMRVWSKTVRRVAPVLALTLALVLAVGVLWPAGRIDAQAAAWEPLGLEGQAISRLYTPASGALFARSESLLTRSDDGGQSWRTIERPADTRAVTVAPTNHDVLYAAGKSGVYRSEDGGAEWQRVSEDGGDWSIVEVSPADPVVVYGVMRTSPPAEYGTNHFHEFRVSHDAGATWEVVRMHRERILPAQHPCGYSVRMLKPHAVSTVQVFTIEGCIGRGMDPGPGLSFDEGRSVSSFPNQPANWGANAAVGGGGVSPDRWYVSLYRPGVAYTRIRASQLMRTDDGGATWTTVFESHGGEPDKKAGRPMDLVSELAYNPQRPDEVFAVFEHYEPHEQVGKEHTLAGYAVQMSRDGGMTWADLGAPAARSISDLAVGVDGRYLFATSGDGVFRIAVPE